MFAVIKMELSGKTVYGIAVANTALAMRALRRAVKWHAVDKQRPVASLYAVWPGGGVVITALGLATRQCFLLLPTRPSTRMLLTHYPC